MYWKQRCKGIIFSVIRHNGVDDDERTFSFEIANDILHKLCLRERAEITAVNHVERLSECFPMVGDGCHFARKVMKGKARHTARLGGKNGGRKRDGFNADGGKYGQANGQRASADAGDIVNGKGAFLHGVPRNRWFLQIIMIITQNRQRINISTDL